MVGKMRWFDNGLWSTQTINLLEIYGLCKKIFPINNWKFMVCAGHKLPISNHHIVPTVIFPPRHSVFLNATEIHCSTLLFVRNEQVSIRHT